MLTLQILCLVLTQVIAADMKTFTVHVGKKAIELFDSREQHLILSKRCQQPDGKLDCDAYAALSRVTLKPPKNEPTALQGIEPGAAVCMRSGGHFVIALNEKHDELGLCQFKDGTLVSGGTLYYHARKNDERK